MKHSTMKFLLTRFKKYIFLLLISIIFISASAYLSLKIPVLVGNCIDLMISKDNVNFTEIYKTLYQIGIYTAIIIVLNYVYPFINNMIAFRFSKDLRNEAFNKVMKLPVKYIDSTSHGVIVNNIITNVSEINDGLILGFTQFFSGITTIILTIFFMFKINWVISILIIVLSPLSIFAAKFVSTRTYKLFKKQSETRSVQTGYIDDTVTNMELIMQFDETDMFMEKFDDINEELATISVKSIFASSLTNPVTRFINNLIYAIVALVGVLFIINGWFGLTLTAGLLSTLLNYANQYTKPFNDISSVITELSNSFACAAKINEMLLEEEITDDTNKLDEFEFNKSINMTNLQFGYDDKKLILTDVNFEAYKGKMIAIVGPTGCGKTTLINLLMRFYERNGGLIDIDGVDIVDIKRKAIRDRIGMVLQDTWLKAGTIRENLILGNPCASQEMIDNACKQTHAYDFIMRLEGGYDFKLKEGANELSEGQRQLLSIARVMISEPDIVILDEATSSIDSRTEIKIQQAFDNLMKGKTSFVVAHRLKTIINADCIIVINDGKIIESGNHQELLAKNGFYNKLYNSQFNN